MFFTRLLEDDEDSEREPRQSPFWSPRKVPLERLPAYLDLLRRTRTCQGCSGSSFRRWETPFDEDYEEHRTLIAAFHIPDADVAFLLVATGKIIGGDPSGDPAQLAGTLKLYANASDPSELSLPLGLLFEITTSGTGDSCQCPGPSEASAEICTELVPDLRAWLGLSIDAREMLFLLTAAALFHGKSFRQFHGTNSWSILDDFMASYFRDCSPNDDWTANDSARLVEFPNFCATIMRPPVFPQFTDEEEDSYGCSQDAPDPLDELKAPLEAFRLTIAKGSNTDSSKRKFKEV